MMAKHSSPAAMVSAFVNSGVLDKLGCVVDPD